MSIEYPTLVHFRHFSSLLTNEYQESSYLRAYKALHLSRTLYKSALFMQNKPNLLDAQMNVSSILTTDYENIANCKLCENKPNTKPIKPNTKPIKANKMPKQTQYKPNTNPIKPNFKPSASLGRHTKNFSRSH